VRRRPSQAVDARRRLSTQRPNTTGTNASRFGPSDLRFDYLTRSHD
jgi:hypothetical protein